MYVSAAARGLSSRRIFERSSGSSKSLKARNRTRASRRRCTRSGSYGSYNSSPIIFSHSDRTSLIQRPHVHARLSFVECHAHVPRAAAYFAVFHILLVRPASRVYRDLDNLPAIWTHDFRFRVGNPIAERKVFLFPIIFANLDHNSSTVTGFRSSYKGCI